jgi:hypothetical protein
MKPADVCVYVYCITEGRPIAAEEGLHPLRPVYSVAHEELLALVSQVPQEEFGEEALRVHLEDACWLERQVRAHELVTEKVMETRTVLPMKFCTIFRTEGGVQALLKNHQEQFRGALERLRGREEWEIKMYLELSAPAGETQLGKAGAGLSGRDYLLKRMSERIWAQEAMNEARRQAQRSYEELAGWVEEIQLKPVTVGGSLSAPRLILDVVCLLPASRFGAFRQELDSLGNKLADKGLLFRLSGPWPPYHFATKAQENASVP